MRRTRPLGWTKVLLALLVTVLLNALAQRIPLRWDLTDSKRYTLSPATVHLLDSLPEFVTITTWFTRELPPDLDLVRQDLLSMLTEYEIRSGGKIRYEVLDPNSDPAIAQQAKDAGIRPLVAQTRERDRTQNIQVFMGAVVRMGRKKATIPVVQRGVALEAALSAAIMEVGNSEKPTIGILQGHGEPSTSAIDQLAVALAPEYLVEATAIYEGHPINERFHSLLILDPVAEIPQYHLDRIDEYMAKGHGVVVAYSTVQGELGTVGTVTPNACDLVPWLARHAVAMDRRVMADLRCGRISMLQAGMPEPIPIEFPYHPLITSFGDHPVVNACDMALFQFSSPMAPVATAGVRTTPLLLSSSLTDMVQVPFTLDLRRAWHPELMQAGELCLGMAVEPTEGNGGRMVVFGNGGFATGIRNGKVVQLPPGNIALMVNAVDWVSHRTALLELRGKETGYRPITLPDDAARTGWKWFNLAFPLGMVALAGMGRWVWRRRQRERRKQPGHVA